MRRKSTLLVLLALSLGGLVALTVGASAVLSSDTIHADQPDDQTVEVDADWTGPSDVTVEVVSSGTVVQSSTVSGSSGDSKTISVPLTGLSTGDFTLNVTATDSSNVSISDRRMVTDMNSSLSANANDTVTVDVEFSSSVEANATVTISDNGSAVNSSTLNFDPVKAEGGTAIKTYQWTTSQDIKNINVSVSTSPVQAHKSAWYETDSKINLFAGFAGDMSDQDMIVLVAVAAFIGFVYMRDN